MEESILVELLENANKRYREGNPIMKDSDYDNYLEQLPKDHWYRNTIESETLSQTTYRHKDKMLSTDKCKTNDDVLKWISKVEKVSSNVNIRTSAKLDGLAGKYYETGELVTRGNGEKGNIVTSAFRKGVINISDSYGIGEIVVVKKYFDENLKGDFSHPRNLAVGITMSDNVTEKAQKALDNNAVHFAVYKDIYSITVTLEEFKKSYRAIEENVRTNTIYPIDGVVIEVVEPEIKEIMGDTSTYHNWQIALKPKDEEAITKVIYRTWQTGRTGKITPVLHVEPTELDGSIIRRVTAHNAKMIRDNELGIGAEIAIIRSGGVIPKFQRVIKKSDTFSIPTKCPSCGSDTVMSSTLTDLLCTSNLCDAQIERKLLHFFQTIEEVDGFGPATIKILVEHGYETISSIYDMAEYDFENCGFGEKTSANLVEELVRSMTKEIDDWRFLAAFGCRILGKGSSKKLLKEYDISDIFDISELEISRIDGFAELSASYIVEDLAKIDEEFNTLVESFTIKYTGEEETVNSPISGKVIVFTGAMINNRKLMQLEAEKLGAKIGSGVSSKTDILVTGNKVGQNKITKAEKHGTKVLTEDEYFNLIG